MITESANEGGCIEDLASKIDVDPKKTGSQSSKYLEEKMKR